MEKQKLSISVFLSQVIWPLGQAVKTPPFHGGYGGSNPPGVTIFITPCGLVVQLVRMPACHAGGRRFEPVPGRQLNIFDLKRLNVILWHIIYLVKCRRSQGSLPEDSVRRACLPGSRHGGYRQVVKTQGCGSCIRGFESHYPPHKISARAEQFMMLGYRQVVRQRILIPSSAGSNPATLANYSVESLWA